MTAYKLVAAYAAAVGCDIVEDHKTKRGARYFATGKSRVVRLQTIVYRKPPEVIIFDSARGFVRVSYRDFLKSKGCGIDDSGMENPIKSDSKSRRSV